MSSPKGVRRAARIVVLDPAGRILLFRFSDPGSGDEFWSTPGGGVGAEESYIEAAERELQEETGLSPLGALEGPIWTRRSYFRWNGLKIDQAEEYYVARTDQETLGEHVTGDHDLENIIDHAWWTTDDLATIDIPIYPSELQARLLAYLDEGWSGRPVEIGP